MATLNLLIPIGAIAGMWAFIYWASKKAEKEKKRKYPSAIKMDEFEEKIS